MEKGEKMSEDKLDIYTKKQDEIKVTKENLPKICRLLVSRPDSKSTGGGINGFPG
jgi:hypothetical protein